MRPIDDRIRCVPRQLPGSVLARGYTFLSRRQSLASRAGQGTGWPKPTVNSALKETAVREVCSERLYRLIAEATLLIGGSTGRSGSYMVKFSSSCSKRMMLRGG